MGQAINLIKASFCIGGGTRPLPALPTHRCLETRLLNPARLEELLVRALDERADWIDHRRQHVAKLRWRSSEAETKLKRLYEVIEDGLVDKSDPSLKDRIGEPTAIRDQARDDAERTEARIERIAPAVTRKSLNELAMVRCRSGRGFWRRGGVL